MSKTKIPGVDNAKSSLDGSTNYGSQFLPTEVSRDIIRRVWEESWVRKTVTNIVMKTQTLKIPKISTGITMQGTTDNADDPEADESRHVTTEIELEMKSIIGNAPIQKKLIAYAVESMMPALMDDIRMSVADTEEDVFVNGDTTSGASNINGLYDVTNFPNGVITRDPRLELDGLRKMAIDAANTVNASGASLTSSHIRSAFAQLGKYGKKKEEVTIVVSNSVETIMYGWDELKTLDKYGPKATVFTGEIGKLYGATVISTSLLSDTLGATGLERNQSTGSSADDKTVVLVFNNRSPIIGNPIKADRKFKIEIDNEPKKDRIVLIPKEDFAFSNRYDEAIAQIINVLPGT